MESGWAAHSEHSWTLHVPAPRAPPDLQSRLFERPHYHCSTFPTASSKQESKIKPGVKGHFRRAANAYTFWATHQRVIRSQEAGYPLQRWCCCHSILWTTWKSVFQERQWMVLIKENSLIWCLCCKIRLAVDRSDLSLNMTELTGDQNY